ncbi:MAG: FABP family protein [Actinobacteria bacterium]|nr:FABP family protein [Actinomycetota bacterium]
MERRSELHPDLEPLAFLLGTWRGEGEGGYPTSRSFRYGEEVGFEHAGDAFLLYSQQSWNLENDEPLHFERGFVRPAGPGRIELVLAHPIGIVEVAEGTVSGAVIDVASTTVGLTQTADPVTHLARHLEVRGDMLVYELEMATRDVPLTRHVKGELRRV